MAEEKSSAMEGGTLTPGHFEKLAPLANYPCRAVAGPPGPVPFDCDRRGNGRASCARASLRCGDAHHRSLQLQSLCEIRHIVQLAAHRRGDALVEFRDIGGRAPADGLGY